MFPRRILTMDAPHRGRKWRLLFLQHVITSILRGFCKSINHFTGSGGYRTRLEEFS